MPPKKKPAEDVDSGGKDLGRSESSELLENELLNVEKKYKATREKVNALREELRLAKLKTKEIFTESREFSEYIDKKREKRHNQIISINDDQRSMLNKLDEQERLAQEEHENQMNDLDRQIRDEEFRRIKLNDVLSSLNHIVRLKEQNDQRISELEAEYAQLKIDDAEKLQKLKVECLEAKRSFKLAAAESAKETQLKLHQDARNLLAEKTESHRRKNNELRKILVNLVGEAKHLSKQKKAVEEQQRKVKADIQFLSSVKR